ncbi:hypothetical protein K432DRAFT_384442 [Lepidopterella palustris CBS 459.81]|uniref:Uncharacterized protein n=1 Tax=Lepidopterella palustris CBS 459.81 TaxID=1314670 RepID=A0A8E2JCU4_9PEZI|nr:hypothetical protein K432DRAFT_384442 [Lepidopterella palustris CBS 459.81]
MAVEEGRRPCCSCRDVPALAEIQMLSIDMQRHGSRFEGLQHDQNRVFRYSATLRLSWTLSQKPKFWNGSGRAMLNR